MSSQYSKGMINGHRKTFARYAFTMDSNDLVMNRKRYKDGLKTKRVYPALFLVEKSVGNQQMVERFLQLKDPLVILNVTEPGFYQLKSTSKNLTSYTFPAQPSKKLIITESQTVTPGSTSSTSPNRVAREEEHEMQSHQDIQPGIMTFILLSIVLLGFVIVIAFALLKRNTMGDTASAAF